MRVLIALGLTLALSTAWAANHGADPIVIEGVGQTLTRACESRPVQVRGTGHNLRLTGQCPRVEVEGTANEVAIEAVDAIEVKGTGNEVTYQRSITVDPKDPDRYPRTESKGVGNSIARASSGN